ncbi:MAG: hypothetical protein HFH68_11485 [Lachnospiraceae bacterium]|nr:hypothetical protein [Lachnospiraceae bacterium]
MKNYIESYHMFFPDKKFRFLLYLVYPITVWTILYVENIFFDGNFILALTAASVTIAVECLADFFVFAGYARKESGKNEYLKTSVKYTQLLKSAFLSDVIRRMSSVLLIICVPAAVLKIPLKLTIYLLFSVYFFITAALFILRFFDFSAAYNFITLIIVILYMFFSIFILDKNSFVVTSIILFISSLLLIAIHINILFRVVKEGYYD